MSLQMGELLLLLLGMGVLFVFGKVPVDLTALLGLMVLVLGSFITPEEAFSGFSSPAVVAMAATFLISAAIRETGLADSIGWYIAEWSKRRERMAMLGVILLAAIFSSVMNNVVAGALLLPAVMQLARISDISPSRLLIPLAFGTIFGGMLTLIGTPPNVVASSMLVQSGLAPFDFFDFFPFGISILITGAALLVGLRSFLPKTAVIEGEQGIPLHELYHLREKLFLVRVPESSSLIGRSLEELELGRILGCRVAEIRRGREHVYAPRGQEKLMGGDLLVVRGNSNSIKALQGVGAVSATTPVEGEPAAVVSPLSELVVESEIADSNLESKEFGLVEVVLSPRSKLIGKSIRDLNFREVYGFLVLAIWRGGEVLYSSLAHLTLAHGDALLLQGPRNRMTHLVRNPDFVVLSKLVPEAARKKLVWFVVLSLICLLGFSASGILPFYIVAVLIALFLVMIGALTMEEGYRYIEWRLLVFTGALIPFGLAVERSGLSLYFANWLVAHVGEFTPHVALLALCLAASFVSQALDGIPATVLFAPVGIKVAQSMGLSPYPFVMGVALSASVAFLTPFSHKVNLLVMGAGGYTVKDYFRVGLPVSIAAFVIIVLLTPVMFPF